PPGEARQDAAGTMVPRPVSATRREEPAADERPEPAPAAAPAAGDAGAERPALGVVAEDGSVVRPKRRTGSARRRWLVSLSSVAAAAAVVAGGFTVTNTVVADGAQTERQTVAAPSTPAEPSQETLAADVDEPRERASRFVIGESGYNYADAELKANLVAYFGSMPSGGSATSDAKLNRCISKLVADEKR